MYEFAVSALNLNSTMELIYYDMKKIKEENQRHGSTDWQKTSHDRKPYLQS
ncbi:MAG: hypothetical protein ACK521_06050 [bacterium]